MKAKSRKNAAMEIFNLQKNMEARPVNYATIYKNITKLNNGNWHYCGRGYDYTA